MYSYLKRYLVKFCLSHCETGRVHCLRKTIPRDQMAGYGPVSAPQTRHFCVKKSKISQARNKGGWSGWTTTRPSAKGPLSQVKVFEHAVKLKSFLLTQSLLPD